MGDTYTKDLLRPSAFQKFYEEKFCEYHAGEEFAWIRKLTPRQSLKLAGNQLQILVYQYTWGLLR